MNRIKRLIQAYGKFIAVPWRGDAAAAQRVIFCVYDENDERFLRARLEEFELVTRQAGHGWSGFDLTNSFAHWLSLQRYAVSYYKNPTLLPPLLPRYLDYLERDFTEFLSHQPCRSDSVVALHGVGTLFGLLRVKDVVDRFAPPVKGRLVVFFPGSYENNNYRLLDGYDGWNYLAVPITAGKD